MSFKYSLLAVIISIGCTIDAGLPAITLAQVPAVVSSEDGSLVEAARIEIKNNRYHEAIELLKKALANFEEKEDSKGKALTLKELGNCYFKSSKYSQAIDYYQQALKLARQLDDRSNEGNILKSLGDLYRLLREYTKAIEYYRQSLKLARQDWKLAGQTWIEYTDDDILNSLGDVYESLGKYPEAIDYYQQSLKLARQWQWDGNTETEARIFSDLGNVYTSSGKKQEAIDYYRKSLQTYQKLGNLSGESYILIMLGDVYESSGKYPEAIDYHKKSLKIVRQLGLRYREGYNIARLGIIYESSGKYPEAIDYYQQALKIARQLDDRSLESYILIQLGNLYESLGKDREAVDYRQQNLQVLRKIDISDDEGDRLNSLGLVYDSLGKYSVAIGYYQQSLKIARQIGNLYDEGNRLNTLGNAYRLLRKYSEAIDYHQQALKVAQKLGNRPLERNSLVNLGNAYRLLRKYSEAIDYYQQALKIARQLGNRYHESVIINALGYSHRILKKYLKAIEYHQQALKIARQLGNRPLERDSLNALGNACRLLGKYPEAIDYYQQVTNIQDSLRINLKDGDKVSLFQTQIQSYKSLASVLILNKDLPGSLVATERGRARAFSDLLSQRLTANPTITKPNTLNFAQIQAQAISRQATIVSYSLPPVDNEAGNFNLKTIAHVISPTGKLTVRELPSPKSVSLSKLVDGNRTELLASRSGSKLTIDRLKPKMLVRLKDDPPDTRRQIVTVDARTQTILLQSIGENPRDTEEVVFSDIAGIVLPTARPELRQLHQLLIAPIADLLPTDSLSPVIFIPDGELYEVPFAALQNERGQYLVDLYTISIVPSLSILAQTAQLKQRNIPRTAPSLVIGNPDFSKLKQRYEQLQFSGDEAREVSALFSSQLLLGDRATESAVKQSLPSARIAHFATHGIRDGSNGLNSGIVLTPSGNDSGILTAEKVLDLKLNADLVVLSACDTGRGQITGDGVIGLSRSFITAGANSVIVSLWSVDDKATAMLMTDFYRQWQGGKSKAQALRAAMLNTKAQYPDPYYWSSMSLYGEID